MNLRVMENCEGEKLQTKGWVWMAALAGTKRGREFQIRLQAQANLHCGVARANHALAFAPIRQGRHPLP